MSTNDMHEEKETLSVDINIPGHDPRVTTPLFSETRLKLLERDGEHCWVCGENHKSSGLPLEAHHYPIERCFTTGVDWAMFAEQAKAGKWGPNAQSFDWASFDPANPHDFVDNMLHNGRLLCKKHHTAAGNGVHTLPMPIFDAQAYLKEGYTFSAAEVIHHEPFSNAVIEKPSAEAPDVVPPCS